MFGFLRKRKQPTPAEPEKTWRDAELFEGLSPSELDLVAPLIGERTIGKGELLVREGELASEIYLVEEGSLEIVKQDQEAQCERTIGEISSGELIGEVSMLDGLPLFATVRATSACQLLVLPFNALRPNPQEALSQTPQAKHKRGTYYKLLERVIRVLADKVRDQADDSLADAKRHAAVGKFLINILVLLCLYSFLLSGLTLLGKHVPSTSFISIPMQIVFALGSWRFIRSTGYPLEQFGLSSRHLFSSALEAIFFTVPVLGLLVGIKWLVLWLNGNPRGLPLIAYTDVAARLSESRVLTLLGIYALTCVVQELIVRGALQSSLQMFLSGPRAKLHAVFIAALLFSMTHLPMSFLFASLAFVPGLFWGWLFARRPNILGVTLSHIVVGGFVFFIMGVNI